MAISAGGTILPLVAVIMLVAGCGGPTENGNTRTIANTHSEANANAAKSNAEELGMLINVPYEAEDIAWKQDPLRQTIIAVFRFSPEDTSKLVAEAEQAGAGQSVVIPVEAWFPDELIAQGEMSGDSTIKGTAYPANAFYQEPYVHGRVARIDESDYFVLELSSN